MKKLLLLALGATSFSALAAVTPVTLDNMMWNKMSANGQYAVSEIYGNLSIYNVNTKQQVDFFADDKGHYYSVGLGNAVSNDGIVVATTSEQLKPQYWDGSKWVLLSYDTEKDDASHMANGITPDGSRICGSLGLSPMTLEEQIMLVPAYWDRNSDGSYGEYKTLPHPDTDWTGRVPQYITALSISDDAKTIVGEVVDYSGFVHDPIVYKQAADGSWSYSLPLHELLNPENVQFPEWPGDSPAQPKPEDFMSEEEQTAYQTAYDAWMAGGFVGDMPEATDYMTPEEVTAYNTAVAEYNLAYNEWSVKYNAFTDVFFPLLEKAPQIVFNATLINPEGTHIYPIVSVTYPNPDPNAWERFLQKDTTWDVDLASNNIVKYEGESSVSATCITSDCILASSGLQAFPSQSFVLKDGEITSMYDYLLARDPELKEWMETNLIHSIEQYDPVSDDIISVEMTITGMAFASRDMKVLGLTMVNVWDTDEDAPYFYAHILDFNQSGVSNVAVSDSDCPVEYFNLQGIRIAEPANGLFIRRQGNSVSKIAK